MRISTIQPRKITVRGVVKWLVHVPLDLQSPALPKDRIFTIESDAFAFAKQLTKERLKPRPSEFNKYPAFEQTEALRWLAEKRKASAITVAEASAQCQKSKEVRLRKSSLAAFKSAMASLARHCGTKSIQSVNTGDLDDWLEAHSEWKPKTKLNNLKYASSLFAWCVRRELLVRNPCVGVERPKVLFKPIQILPINDIAALLETCQKTDPALLGFICLVLFGGLRVTESARCTPADLANGRIDLGGEKCKLGNRRGIPINPQLAAWLAVPGVEIGGKNLNNRMNVLAKNANVVLTKNCLRHSFCSYNLQLIGAAATARAANNSEAILNRHYLANVTLADAQKFEALRPK